MELLDRKEKVLDYFHHKNKRMRINNKYELINERNRQADKMELLQLMQELVVELKDVTILEETQKSELKARDMDIIDSEIKELKEAYEMKINRINGINKIHIEFLMSAFIAIIISLIGLIIFSINGFYLIHPYIYILGIIMGIGWGATAITSIRCNYKNERR